MIPVTSRREKMRGWESDDLEQLVMRGLCYLSVPRCWPYTDFVFYQCDNALHGSSYQERVCNTDDCIWVGC